MRRLRNVVFALLIAVTATVTPAASTGSVMAGNCFITEIWSPYLTAGPAIRSIGVGRCQHAVSTLNVRVWIYMRGGPCSSWCEVAFNSRILTNTTGPISTTATTGRCAGTRQYYARVQVLWYTGPSVAPETDTRDTYVKTITCG
jgi:hypothetical protein